MSEDSKGRWQNRFFRAMRKTGNVNKALDLLDAKDWQRLQIVEWLKMDGVFIEGVQDAKQKKWLRELRATGSVTKACDALNITIVEALHWAERDKIFADDWTKLVEKLEDANRLRIKDLVEPAIAVKKKILEKGNQDGANAKEMFLANLASDRILSGTGHLKENPTVAVDARQVRIDRVEIIMEGGKVVEERHIDTDGHKALP